jgi:hypothetical protein
LLIVLEGVDLGGKSTLARELQRWHRGPSTLLHQGPPPDLDLVELYERPLLDPVFRKRALSPLDLVILDRWETGELVYGPLFRGASRLSAGQALHVDLLLRSLGAVRVLAQPKLASVVKSRYRTRGDDLLDYHDVDHVHAFYEGHAWYHDWVRGVAFDDPVDIGAHHAHRPSDLLLSAESATLAASRLEPYPGYLGHPWPDALLVGERRADGPGARPAPWTDKAFTPLGRHSCGQWLLDALESVGLLRVGLANAHEPGMDVGALWAELSYPVVVALGNAAAIALTERGVPFGRVPHPQYARRFKYKEFEWYAARLAEEARKGRWRGVDQTQLVPLPER